jgi:hypothetical protein
MDIAGQILLSQRLSQTFGQALYEAKSALNLPKVDHKRLWMPVTSSEENAKQNEHS